MAYPITSVILFVLIQAYAASAGCGGNISITKFYDANANAVFDSGDAYITGWIFQVTNLQTNKYVYYTSPFTIEVPPGQYQVCDLAPNEVEWKRVTGNGCATLTVTAGSTASATFPCLCLGSGEPSSAQNWGFWLTGAGKTLITPADWAALDSLNLRTITNANFDPTDVTTLYNWYKSATSANVSYYLSAQLSITTLNLNHYLSHSQYCRASAFAPLVGYPYGFMPVTEMTAYANSLLQVYTSQTAIQMVIAGVLKNLNSDGEFVQFTQCPFSFQPVSPMQGSSADKAFTTVVCPTTQSRTTALPPPPATTAAVRPATTAALSPATTGSPTCTYGCLDLHKIYDLNGNGQADAGEPDINGWMFRVTDLSTGYFSYYEAPSTIHLPQGTYEVCDLQPLQFNWFSSGGSLCKTYQLTSTSCVRAIGACVCFGDAGVSKSAYWLSTAGRQSISSADLAALRDLNLVNAAGAAFDPTTADDLANFYSSAPPSNVNYYLSAQLAFATLDARHGFDGTRIIKAPSVGSLISPYGNFLVQFNTLLQYANNYLASPSSPTIGQDAGSDLKNLVEDKNYVQTTACPFSFPALATTEHPLRAPSCAPPNTGLSVRSAMGKPYMCCDTSGPQCPSQNKFSLVAGSLNNVVDIGNVDVTETVEELLVTVTFKNKCWKVNRVDQFLSTHPLVPDVHGLVDPLNFTYVKDTPTRPNFVKGRWPTARLPGASRSCYDDIYASLHLSITCDCDSCDGFTGTTDAWAQGTGPFPHDQFGYSTILQHCCDSDAIGASEAVNMVAPDLYEKRALVDAAQPSLLASQSQGSQVHEVTLSDLIPRNVLFLAASAAGVLLIAFAAVSIRDKIKHGSARNVKNTNAPTIVQPSVSSDEPKKPLNSSLHSVTVLRLRQSSGRSPSLAKEGAPSPVVTRN